MSRLTIYEEYMHSSFEEITRMVYKNEIFKEVPNEGRKYSNIPAYEVYEDVDDEFDKEMLVFVCENKDQFLA